MIVENLPVPFDRRVWMEATTLKEAGYQVSIICPTGKGHENLYEEIDGISIYRHRLPPEKSSPLGYIHEYSVALWSQWKLAHKVRRERGVDIIHACNPPDLIFLIGAWFKIFYGTRFIFDHHDLCPELYEAKFGKKDLFYHALKVAERLTFLLADTVISPNESYKHIAERRGGKDPKTIYVVRSAPRLDSFKPVEGNPRYRRGRRYLVGYLGVMGEFDGVDHLIKAAHELIVKRGRGDIHFCLIGSGPAVGALKGLVDELSIGDYIEFTGRIPDTEVIDRLSTSDVCVGPDPLNPLNNQSTMNKILEYMALERPIVQYDLLEGRRSAGEASAYAEPNNVSDLATQIESLLSNPGKRAQMGLLGRRRMMEGLEWLHQIPTLLRAYESTIAPS